MLFARLAETIQGLSASITKEFSSVKMRIPAPILALGLAASIVSAQPASAAVPSTVSYAVGCSTHYGGVDKYRQANLSAGSSSFTLGPTTWYNTPANNGNPYQFRSSVNVQVWTKQGGYKVVNGYTSNTIAGTWGTIQWTDSVYQRGSNGVYTFKGNVTCKTYQ